METNFDYLKNWLLENGELDMYDLADDLDKPIEIDLFDENGWRIVESLWYDKEDDQLKGWTSDDGGKEHEENIILSDDDLCNIISVLKRNNKYV